MSIKDPKKICVVVKSLSKGGAERSAAILTQILDHMGHQVHVVSVLNEIDYEFKGKLFNLGLIKSEGNGSLNRVKRFVALYKYFKREQFDYIIDNRTRIRPFEEFVISKLIYGAKKSIYCVRSYHFENYLGYNRLMAKLIYGNAFKIIAVSEAIKEELEKQFSFSNIEVIQNPIIKSNKEAIDNKSIAKPYLLYFGRLDDKVKNIRLLLEAYDQSLLSEKGVSLVIMGQGKDELELKEYAATMTSSNSISFLGFEPSPENIIKNARFTVLTSRYEGFPRMLLESLSLGVPVVSVDCKSGPNELIEDHENGLLVPNDDVKALSRAFQKMLNDEALYNRCLLNAEKSVAQYQVEPIGRKWSLLFK